MTAFDYHEPSYSGTTTDDWDAPQKNDFNTDDLGEIADHFALSATGFPPENFTDLKLPVVDPDGKLNENALQTAHGGAHSVEAIDGLTDDAVESVKDLLEDLAQEAFDEDISE
ncbi:hypothetical protein ACFQH3_12975 [Haladaptatus sp. GCM10025707]|uniref:hypothetical protein n=1 Tax=unclassified Haladaptatus TaxID=2622732 RepID=UPI0023E899C0|nr:MULTISPECIES: hypothetical protein [unclassified Haladaptatus]